MGADLAYSKSAITAASAKLAVAAMMKPAEARPTISPQRLSGSGAWCARRMDYFLLGRQARRLRRQW